jgi:hypothetical protein
MRYTISRLMWVIATCAIGLASVRIIGSRHTIILITFCLTVRMLREFDLHSKKVRLFAIVTLPAVILLTGGWTWAKLAISSFQGHEGSIYIGSSTHVDYYTYWGLIVPFVTTSACIATYFAACLSFLLRNRDVREYRRPFLFGVCLVTVALIFAVADLEFYAFD